ncbi:50S ribosomal protein L24 [Salinibacter ruber]|uniref:Large ribosomal subunit protein uL24 n=1 Tax=Salinibacter ruber TaxID=146919 RepID=A0A9X2UP83_9BACT|nr:50S ribosomal protein L24 [Salinibacter ruber]MCS3612243.1 large subunit ribosomal protein L24 [Salinibacter ruber]MCS3615299.1 large subunit ribosomal protein L24 [Salinibacter ruber]MCS3783987.1 large subunit ribosomal protein L24 [Salinibacter ruber]MCS4037639.1 large subunit ribosomal protein L24 [Salinibacter ruber]
MAQNKLHVKQGDMVMLNKTITSAKSAGEDREAGYVGKVLKVFPDEQRVVVEGVNVRVFHEKPSRSNREGGRTEREAPIHVSNVNPIDSNGESTRIGRKKVEDPDTGRSRWVRYAKTTGEELDD